MPLQSSPLASCPLHLSVATLVFSNAILSLQHQTVLSPSYFSPSSFMPTITSQRTGPAARRQRRRTRQRQKLFSTAFPHRQRNHRRSIPKRQLREQSTDVDDCFEDCQEFGYHLEPDVYVGSLVAQGNPFSLLEPNYSTYSTPDPIPTPYRDHTIPTLNPFLTEREWHVAKKSYPKLKDIERPIFTQAEEREASLQLASKFWWHSHGQIDDLEANRPSLSNAPLQTARHTIPPSVQTSSIPATPPSGASIKLPGSFPQDIAPASASRPSKKRKLNDSPPPSFPTAYRILSPLLYPKPSRDGLANTEDEDNNCICLGPSFEHTREEHQSNCGPKCHQILHHRPSTDLEAEATGAFLQNQYHFVAATLPNIETVVPYSPVEEVFICSDPEFYTNTRPYLSSGKLPINSKVATGSSIPRTGRNFTSPEKAKKFTSHIYTAEDLRLTDAFLPAKFTSVPVISVPAESPVLQQPRPLIRNHELVFPQAPSSTVCRERSLDRYFERTTNFRSKKHNADEQQKVDIISLNNNTVDYYQDRPSKFQDLWDAYEKAVLGQDNQRDASTRALSVLSSPLCPLPIRSMLPIVGLPGPQKSSTLLPAPVRPVRPSPIDLKLPKEINNAEWAFSPCTVLIPATPYERQYLELKRHCSTDIWTLAQRPLPTSNAIFGQIRETQSHGRIRQALDWLIEDLDLDKVFDDEPEDEVACLPWLQAGWDGHLFYPEAAASEIPLALSSPFEDVELGDEGQVDNSGSWDGTQVNEEAEEDMWWDWDDDASGWSEPSEHEFFDFDL